MSDSKKEFFSTKRRRPKKLTSLFACSAALLAVGLLPAQSHAQHPVTWDDLPLWDSQASGIYPEDWEPGDVYEYEDENGNPVVDEERFLHDWSYAGYYYGEREPYTNVGSTYDVTEYPFLADNTGQQDATLAINAAISFAGNAGGGIVYLPAGTYKLSVRDGKRYALWLNKSNVILRGDGENTKLFWDENATRGTDLIRVSPYAESTLSWSYNEIDPVEIIYDVDNGSTSFQVDDASNYAVGDWVVLRTDATKEFSQDHGMGTKWEDDPDNPTFQGIMFLRQITAIDTSTLYPTVTVNVPTRYFLRESDGARMYKVDPLLQNIGLEDFQIGVRENETGGSCSNPSVEGTCAYDTHKSIAININHAIHGWVRNIETFAPSGNSSDVHLQSHGIWLEYASFFTFDNLYFAFPQNKGVSGNGYMIQMRGGENILKNSRFHKARHNISYAGFYSTGNVVLNTNTSRGSLATDFHRNLSPANLFDGHSLLEEELQAKKRGTWHGHGTTQSVFWNTKQHEGSTGSLVLSQQYGMGYVVGTSDGLEVNVSAASGTSPADHTEFLNAGETLWPQSLYLDQFRRRMERGEFLSGSLPNGGASSSSLTNSFNSRSSYDFEGIIDAPVAGTWYYETRGGSVTVADFPSESDKSLLLKDQSTDYNVVAHRRFKERSTPINVEFKVYLVTGNTSYYSVWGTDSSGEEKLAARIKINASNNMLYVDGSGSNYGTLSSSAKTGQWYNFKIIVDPQSDTAFYYLDGTLVAPVVDLANSVDSVHRFTFQSDKNTRGALYFDHLVVKNH